MKTSVLSSLYIMHKAMLAGQVIFTAIIFYLLYSKNIQPAFVEQEKTMQVVALLIAFVGIFTGAKLFNSKMMQLRQAIDEDIQNKLTKYRTASLILWVLIEIPCLVAGICLMLTGGYAFLALGVVIILYFALQAPSKAKAALHLGVSNDELAGL